MIPNQKDCLQNEVSGNARITLVSKYSFGFLLREKCSISAERSLVNLNMTCSPSLVSLTMTSGPYLKSSNLFISDAC